jgi:hypothetical protein
MINLLPPEQRKFLVKEQQKKLFIVLSMEIAVFLVCLLLVMLATEFYISGEISYQSFFLQQVQIENQSSDFSDFKKIILKYNKELVLIDAFYKGQKSINSALNTLLDVQKPDGLRFNNLSFQPEQQTDNIKVNIDGTSDTRDNLLIFKNNIDGEKRIKNVSFSPGSWVNQKNINFDVTLDILNENGN